MTFEKCNGKYIMVYVLYVYRKKEFGRICVCVCKCEGDTRI